MDNILLNKIATLERCIKRIKDEYFGYEDEFKENYTKQDSIILNIQRACHCCIDIATHIVRIEKFGIPQTNREVFVLLENAKIINKKISKKMQSMVGFRNIAVHDYQNLNFDIVKAIIERHLEDFGEFKDAIFKKYIKN